MTDRFCKVEAVRAEVKNPTPWVVELREDEWVIADGNGSAFIRVDPEPDDETYEIVDHVNEQGPAKKPVTEFVIRMDPETFRGLMRAAHAIREMSVPEEQDHIDRVTHAASGFVEFGHKRIANGMMVRDAKLREDA